jgi:hypothetical protein
MFSVYSLFEPLFKSGYWRMVLRKATWHEAGTSLRRAHKDRRARRHLLGVGLLLLIPVLCLFYLAWLAGSGAIFLAPFVIPVYLWRRRRERQDAVPLRIAPGPPPLEKVLSDEERPALRRYFAELMLFYAVMVDRAGSEAFLKEKELPEGFVVTSRRIHIDLLRNQGLWNRMARVDLEAMMMADGHWEWEKIHHASLAMEPLRLLRWMLRVDFYLPTVGQQQRGEYGIAHELVHTPQKALEGKGLTEISVIRIGRDAAADYFGRCLAEGISRGYYEARDDAIADWAKNISERMKGQQHDDLVVDGKLVSETTESELRWAVSLSQRRLAFLDWAMGVMESGGAPDRQMSVFAEEESYSTAEN